MHIGLTYDLQQDYLDAGYSEEQTAEFDSIVTIDSIEDVLRSAGHELDRIGNARALIERLTRGDRWDLVFNICEGMHGFGREALVPALLEAHEIPCTFSDSLVCALTLHKGMAKRVVRDLGLPTARFEVVERPSDIDRVDLAFPLFAKPVAEGTSKGVTQQSRCESKQQLVLTCRNLLSTFRQPVLVEEYLPGREFTVGILGTGDAARVIGAMEVIALKDMGAETEGYSYANKHDWVGKLEYHIVTGPLAEQAHELALNVWRGLGCRDAGRVDMRADRNGTLNFIEVNPLPGIHPQISDLTIISNLCGLRYPDLINGIVESASKRMSSHQPSAVAVR